MAMTGSTMKTARENDLLPCLSGFESIKRYWDKTREVYSAKILPGEYYVTKHNELITTVLGSCVSACIRDPNIGIGGMNHFMLPSTPDSGGNQQVCGESERYGNYAMEHMINDILKYGGKRKDLEVKIFGGGRILRQMTDIGSKNIEFVKNYIAMEGIKLTSEDVGDTCPRKVLYFPLSGKVLVKRLQSLHNGTVIERERSYMKNINNKPIAGDIELF